MTQTSFTSFRYFFSPAQSFLRLLVKARILQSARGGWDHCEPLTGCELLPPCKFHFATPRISLFTGAASL